MPPQPSVPQATSSETAMASSSPSTIAVPLTRSRNAAAQRVDPDLVLDYICEPLPAPDQL